MARGKAARSRAAKERRSAEEQAVLEEQERREAEWDQWRSVLSKATVKFPATPEQVAVLARKSMKTNPDVVVTEELVQVVVGLIRDQMRPGDKKWYMGNIEVYPDGKVEWVRR